MSSECRVFFFVLFVYYLFIRRFRVVSVRRTFAFGFFFTPVTCSSCVLRCRRRFSQVIIIIEIAGGHVEFGVKSYCCLCVSRRGTPCPACARVPPPPHLFTAAAAAGRITTAATSDNGIYICSLLLSLSSRLQYNGRLISFLVFTF